MARLGAILVLLVIPVISPVQADPIKEIGTGELRRSVAAGESIPVGRVMRAVREKLGAEPVDVRAFRSEDIYYRVLAKRPDGRLVGIVVNSRSGALLSAKSRLAQDLNSAAKPIRIDLETPHIPVEGASATELDTITATTPIANRNSDGASQDVPTGGDEGDPAS